MFNILKARLKRFWKRLMLKAYQGEMFKLPIVGDIAEKGL